MQKDQMIMIDYLKASTRLLNYPDYSQMSYRDKLDLFFVDYNFIPLIIQDNYLQSMTSRFNKNSLQDVTDMA